MLYWTPSLSGSTLLCQRSVHIEINEEAAFFYAATLVTAMVRGIMFSVLDLSVHL